MEKNKTEKIGKKTLQKTKIETYSKRNSNKKKNSKKLKHTPGGKEIKKYEVKEE